MPGSAAPGPCVTPWLHGRRDRGCTAAVTKVVIKLGADRDEDCSCTCVLCPGMFSGDTGRHPRRNRSAAAPPRTQGHVAGQSIHGRHGPTTAPIATGHAHAHLIRHRACEQTCPALTARPATPGRGCHRPPRPTFAVTVQEHLNSTQDHQKVVLPPTCPVYFEIPLHGQSYCSRVKRRLPSSPAFTATPSAYCRDVRYSACLR